MTFELPAVIHSLRTLHRIQRQLTDLRGQLAHGPRVVKVHETKAAEIEAELEQARKDVVAARVAVDAKQLQLNAAEEKIQKRQTQLMEAQDNKEYSALNDQISAATMVNSVLEDEILDALENLDQLNEKVVHAGGALEKAHGETEAARQRFAEKEPIIRAELDRLYVEMRPHEEVLPQDLRDIYDRTVRTRGEQALAEVRDEFCSGCHQHIPVNLINKLMLGTTILCDACGRLLYLPEET